MLRPTLALLCATALAAAPAAQAGPAAPAPVAGLYDGPLAAAMRSEREAAAARIESALEAGAEPAALRAAAAAAAAELAAHPASRAAIEALLLATADGAQLERGLERTVADLRFRPYVEAEVPLGWPTAAPVGVVVLKSYPRYRMARTEASARRGTSTPFFALFNHIQRNEIAMTAPVQMDRADRGGAMAFLYARPDQGEAGTDARDERVEVVDVEPALAISIGARGYETPAKTAELEARLSAWQREHAGEFEVAGPFRTMGYNSPMVPSARRFFEVELPVRRIQRPAN
jgi:hypothetical protein